MMFVAFSLKDSAPRFIVDLGVFRRRTSIQGQQNVRGFKARHDRAAWWVGKKEMGVKTIVACVGCGRLSPNFPGPMEEFQKQRRVERSPLEKYMNGLNP